MEARRKVVLAALVDEVGILLRAIRCSGSAFIPLSVPSDPTQLPSNLLHSNHLEWSADTVTIRLQLETERTTFPDSVGTLPIADNLKLIRIASLRGEHPKVYGAFLVPSMGLPDPDFLLNSI